jgi:hypothetical protein
VAVTDEGIREALARIDGHVRELRGEIKETRYLMIQCVVGICILMTIGFMFMFAGLVTMAVELLRG